jgi:colanic acid/amylovoran biosynthesis glycosyltransferase
MKTVAIFSPNENAYSETFIQAHKRLPFKIKFYFNGWLPTFLESKGSISNYNVLSRIRKRLYPEFNFKEFSLFQSLKKERIDCVLAEYGPSACESLKVIKALNIPLIVHFHGFDATDNETLQNYKTVYKQVFLYASFIIVVSKKMFADIKSLGCPDDKIILNPYGPNESFYKLAPVYNKRRFVAIGRFVDKKAPYLTLMAFKMVLQKHPDTELIFGGDGPLLNTCKNLAKIWGLNHKVEFKGKLAQNEVMLLFENAIAFLQHSITDYGGDSEGTPVTILEASASKLPIISTRHAGIPDVVVEGMTGFLVDELDINSMANYMISLIESPDIVVKLGEQGRKYIKENFSLAMHLDKITSLINESC